MSKQFYIGDILTITTGRLVTPDHMDGVYSILNYMTGDNLFTHQLPRASKICEPFLVRQYPQFSKANMSDAVTNLDERLLGVGDRSMRKEIVDAWVNIQVEQYGEYFDVDPIPPSRYEAVDPMSEAEALVGKDRVIVCQLPPKEE